MMTDVVKRWTETGTGAIYLKTEQKGAKRRQRWRKKTRNIINESVR
jgi:hypothetical protein